MDNKTKSLILSIPAIKLIVLSGFYILLQIVILLQRPFIQYDFIFMFYSSLIFISGLHFLSYILKIKSSVVVSFLEILIILCLYKSQPLFASFYLVMILVLLFLAGLQLEFKDNVNLVFATSVLVSVYNLFFIKWTGLQNILNLGLFNLAFIAVLFFSTQLKLELYELSESLLKTVLKLKSKADLAQLLIENMPAGLLAVTSNQDVVFSNSTLEKKLSLDLSSAKELIELQKSSYGQQNSNEIAYYNTALADKRYYQIESTSYFDSDYEQNIQMHLIKDTTRFRELQDKIKHQEKMAAVGQLAAGIAHEIRNPLAGISGSVELLSQDAQNPDDQKLMRIILKEIDRLNLLITDFLDYSKPEKRPDQKTDLALILDEVIQNIKLSAQTPKDLIYNIQIQTAIVFGASDKLKQAFMNIIVNAVQAMNDRPEKILSIKTSATADCIVLEVSDTGSGMSLEGKKRIFEPFYTTKTKGTGLGMAITHKVFESHSADVQIESEINKGTQFKIIFNKAI